MQYQQTLKGKLELEGTELYGGNLVRISISPDCPDRGIIFTNLIHSLKTSLDNFYSTRFSTRLSNGQFNFEYAEHVLATLYAYGIDNASIYIERNPSLSFQALKLLGRGGNTEVVPEFPRLQRDLCEAIESAGVEVQDKPRKMLRLEEVINTGRLKFEPIPGDNLIITAYTFYPQIGLQTKEVILTPESYKEISDSRRYGKWLPRFLPKAVLNFLGSFAYPSFGIGHGISRENTFLPVSSREEWLMQERMKSEIACHTIIDRLGALATLPGRLVGVHLTCKFSSHSHDIETLKKFEERFKKQTAKFRHLV